MRTSWRRLPHEQAGIVSVRLGTLVLVTSPHAWQTNSAMATMSGWIPELDSSHPMNLPTRRLKPEAREAVGLSELHRKGARTLSPVLSGPAGSFTSDPQ
jgi:hypothetical protein